MKAKLLLVDDEENFIETLAERLRNRNYDVTTALNGEDALQKINEYDIDIAIIDVMMPGLSGIETLSEIKRLKPLVEAFMLTGHATVETAIEGMKLGAYDYLMKPCDMDQLLAKIEEAKDKKSKHEEKIREAKVKELSTRFV
ncbi:MAG: response regulator [Pseudomonadota bacterium]